MQQIIFFAYESGHFENKDAIYKAIIEYNKHQKSYRAKTWEELRISDKIINKNIMNEIDKCEIFACDMTYINYNVLFELGYAVGKRRKTLIFLNSSIEGVEKKYHSFKIFNNIGYSTFNNYKGIHAVLQGKNKMHINLLDQLINLNKLEKNINDIFFITSKVKNQAFLDLQELINSLKLKIIHDDTSEVEYQTLIWYLKNIYKAKNVIIHLMGPDKIDHQYYNAESAFFAGLACALNKKVLLIAPFPFNAPIDYSDILVEYENVKDCVTKTKEWIAKYIDSPIEDIIKKKDATGKDEEKKLNILRLGIGCEIAEEERNDLYNYFIEIEAYRRAIERSISILIGRKGTGKTAIFLILKNELNNNENDFNIILKPDSEDLLENIEMSKLYNSVISKKSFFKTVWSYVLFSKLFLNIKEKIDIKSSKIKDYEKSYIESKIIKHYEENHDLLTLNFFGAIKKINEIAKGKILVDDPGILGDFYKKTLNPIKSIIIEYFKDKKYYNINILADNLDSAWQSQYNLDMQSEMILSLLEFSNKIFEDLKTEKSKEIIPNIMIFLRKDIFDYILKLSREPDKLIIRSYEINWNNYPHLLKELIEKRFKYILNLDNQNQINDIWDEYFAFDKSKTPFEVIKKIVASRPRDIIFFISKLFESAVNKDHTKANNEDLIYAINAYSNYLHQILIAEIKGEFPEIEEILYEIQQKNIYLKIPYKQFNRIVSKFNYSDKKIEALIESLFNKNYMIGFIEKTGDVIRKLDLLKNRIKEKNFLLFKKNKISIMLSPKRSFN